MRLMIIDTRDLQIVYGMRRENETIPKYEFEQFYVTDFNSKHRGTYFMLVILQYCCQRVQIVFYNNSNSVRFRNKQ